MRTERYVDMRSPFTGGRVKEVFYEEEKEFRKETYRVHVRYYICEDTGEQFTATEQDTLFCNDLYSQYRNRHDIPFPDEIKSIRERYGFSYVQMSRLMGFGINQWKQYEEGTVPSESNARLISTARSKSGMRMLLENSRSAFDEKVYLKMLSKIDSSHDISDADFEQNLFYRGTERGIFNGLASFDSEKLKAMVKFLIANEGYSVCPTKLNKEMFYSDFHHFMKTGKSVSGLSYRAIQYGPVPARFETIYDNIEGINKVRTISYDMESVKLELCRTDALDLKALEDSEISSLEHVSSELAALKTSEVVEKSHKEAAWLDNVTNHSLIAYSYAYLL